MAFDTIIASAAIGTGPLFAFDTFTDTDAVDKVMPYSAIAFGPQDGPYQPVDSTHGLPVAVVAALPAGTAAIGKLAANSGVIIGAVEQSGTWNVGNVSGTISLPTGAATSAKQDTLQTTADAINAKLPALGQALAAGSVPVVLTAAQISTLTPLSTVAATQSGSWNIVNVSGTITLPTGASTAARQDTGNTSLASIDTKTPALGQALAAASVPVVLTAAQLTTLTPLATVAATQSGTWNIGTLATISNVVHVDDNAGSLTVDNAALSVVGAGNEAAALRVTLANNSTGVIGVTDNGGSITVDNNGTFAVQASIAAGATSIGKEEDTGHITGDVGAAMLAVRRDTPTSLVNADNDYIPLTTNSTGHLWVAAAQSGTWNITNVSGTISLPTGAATAANQSTANTSLASIDGKIVAVNTGAVVVSSSALPSGAATAAKQPALGTAGTASADVITVQGIASMTALVVDGSAVTQPISAAALPLPSGAATSAKQDTQTGHLGTLAGAVSGTEMQVDIVSGSVSISGAIDTELTTADLDTGGGTDTRAVVGLVLAASGGGVLVGSANPMPVSDNGGSLTVDGSVTANAGTNLNTSLLALEAGGNLAAAAASLALLDNAIAGNELQVDVLTMPSVAVTNVGTFVVQIDGTALTRLTDIETNTDSGAVVGNGAAATAQRVTLANDSTGIVALTTSSATIGKLAANSGVDIGDTDVTSVIPGTGATNLGKAIDTATGATDTGVLALATRDDALSALTPAEGDNVQLRTDANGALWVIPSGTITVAAHAVTNAGTFVVQENGAALTALQLIDDSVVTLGTTTYTEASSKGLTVGAVRRDADTTLVDTTNEFAPLIVDARGFLKVEAFSGETLPVSLASVPSHAVTNAGTFAVQVDGAALTALQLIDDVVFAEDSAHNSTDKGVQVLAVRRDTASALGADNDYTPPTTNARAAMWVAIEDGAGGQITTFGGGTQYTEDAAAAANPVGTALNLVRADSLAAVTSDDGDNVAARGTNKGELYVKHVDALTVSSHAVTNAGTFAVQVDGSALTSLQLIDDVVFTDDTSTHSTGSTKGVGIMAAATPTDSAINANDIGMVAMTTDRKLHVAVMDALPAGTAAIGKLAANSGVDIGDVDVTSVIPGTGATNLGKAEDAGHTTGDTGISFLGVRRDAEVDSTSATTDYICPSYSKYGAAWVTGDLQHDSVDEGNPVKLGAKAIAYGSNPSAVAANDRTHLYANRAGIPFVHGGHPNTVTRTVRIADADGAQTNVSIAGTIGSGTKLVVTRLKVQCSSANTGNVRIQIGFGTASVPAASATGADGILLDETFAGGQGSLMGDGVGVLGVGADGEELRLTCDDPVGGAVTVSFSYFSIES